MRIAVSFLACKKYKKAISLLDYTDTDYVHVDVIDNKLVKGRKISLWRLKKLDTLTSKRLDVHLMVKKPKRYIQKLALLNVERIVFHVEVPKDIEKNLELVRSFGVKNGLAINPDTDVSALVPYLDKIDTILVMSVNPGYGGQAFIEESVERVKEIKKMIKGYNIEISVDGGIKEEQVKKLADADIIISGSFVTNSTNYQEQINKLRIASIIEEKMDPKKVLKEIEKEASMLPKKKVIRSKSSSTSKKTTKKIEEKGNDKKKKTTKKKA